MPQRLYCYVDESGQHNFGQLFVVSVVLAGPERDDLLQACELIEERTGKGRLKWIKTACARRSAYLRQVFDNPLFCGPLNFAIFQNNQDYPGATALIVAKAIRARREVGYKATVTIDGLTRAQQQTTAVALIRLADSVCGLVVAALEGQTVMCALFDRALGSGFLKDISGE